MDSHLWEMLGVGVTIIGANYLFVRDVRTDLKEQMSKFEDRMETIDARWATLFEKFHILDKNMRKFRLPSRGIHDFVHYLK